MDGWIVFLLVVIALVLILGRKQFARTVGFLFAGAIALMILILVFSIPKWEREIQRESESQQESSVLSLAEGATAAELRAQREKWQKLKEGMLPSEVAAILGEPLNIVSDRKSATWYYSRDTGFGARVDFEKKLLRFRLQSWKEPEN